jgi:hypothetical protein
VNVTLFAVGLSVVAFAAAAVDQYFKGGVPVAFAAAAVDQYFKGGVLP